LQLHHIYFPTLVDVEILKDIVQVVFSVAVFVAEAAGQKFIVANLPIFVHVDTLEDGVKFIVTWMNPLPMQSPFDLINAQKSVII
jgi:hypothetical protein